jgi:hypothetical protein
MFTTKSLPALVTALGAVPPATLRVVAATCVICFGLYRMSRGKLALSDRKLIAALSLSAFVLLAVPDAFLAPVSGDTKARPDALSQLMEGDVQNSYRINVSNDREITQVTETSAAVEPDSVIPAPAHHSQGATSLYSSSLAPARPRLAARSAYPSTPPPLGDQVIIRTSDSPTLGAEQLFFSIPTGYVTTYDLTQRGVRDPKPQRD